MVCVLSNWTILRVRTYSRDRTFSPDRGTWTHPAAASADGRPGRGRAAESTSRASGPRCGSDRLEFDTEGAVDVVVDVLHRMGPLRVQPAGPDARLSRRRALGRGEGERVTGEVANPSRPIDQHHTRPAVGMRGLALMRTDQHLEHPGLRVLEKHPMRARCRDEGIK